MSESKTNASRTPHGFVVKERKSIQIEGVKEVTGFDEYEVELTTELGYMIVEGNALKIGVLDTDSGRVVISGTVNAVYYGDEGEKKEKKNFFQRFRG